MRNMTITPQKVSLIILCVVGLLCIFVLINTDTMPTCPESNDVERLPVGIDFQKAFDSIKQVSEEKRTFEALAHKKIQLLEEKFQRKIDSGIGKDEIHRIKKDKKLPHYKLFIAIKSTPQHMEARKMIRESWIRYFTDPKSTPLPQEAKVDMTWKFFFGQANITKCRPGRTGELCNPNMTLADVERILQKESDKHGDIVRLKVIEHYWNLSEKLIQTLVWAATNEEFTFDYFLGVDDDAFPRFEWLYPELIRYPPVMLYWGRFHSWVPSIDPVTDYPHEIYAPYTTGILYGLSTDLVDFLAENGQYFVRLLPDDAALGWWMDPLKISKPDYRWEYAFTSGGFPCDKLVVHKPRENFVTIFDEIQNNTRCSGVRRLIPNNT
eukprot:TRINITY_DN690_c0_g1_i1.p1 TRINITY_DN690_c0_g1~~TRINITY_DN690_c0_g1_i1.p1  ORF type:complete len:380 (+),score=53.25 TRINITY_DN690_c0_g1_i1:232-1371(+)